MKRLLQLPASRFPPPGSGSLPPASRFLPPGLGPVSGFRLPGRVIYLAWTRRSLPRSERTRKYSNTYDLPKEKRKYSII
ncbi:hypothetical protein DY000_02014483 [Brassica cretica]|uniref:Uncharacterized protein n=1 Tax=Brassica cretica TaxID=69181 RepID=A0ABQ7DCF4_BRACR|nr:hypothetical protein DY000_02014483 [Brassica cretica]